MSRRTSRSRAESLSPALFPFLAVLVCTMGALVLILVIVVSQASASAKTALQAEEQALLEASDLVVVASEEMIAQRKKQQEAIDNRRSQLAAIEDHISRLMDELKRLEQQSKAMQDQSTQSEQERHEQARQLQELEQKLAQEQSRLEEARQRVNEAAPAFAILPYQGSNGTTRRPIYLECTQRGVVIQPEGVVISVEDLKPPYGPGNPLDASLRLIRSSYRRLDPNGSAGVSPYPLLLVRPDGIKAYVLARAAMNGWDDQFGYELIDQEMPLAFPPSLPGLSKHLAENLEVARQRQVALIAAMPRRYGSENEWDDTLEEIDRSFVDSSSRNAPQARNSASEDWSAIDGEIVQDLGQGRWNMIAEVPATAGQPIPPNAPLGKASSPPDSSLTLRDPRATAPSGPYSAQELQRMQQAASQGAFDRATGMPASSTPFSDGSTAGFDYPSATASGPNSPSPDVSGLATSSDAMSSDGASTKGPGEPMTSNAASLASTPSSDRYPVGTSVGSMSNAASSPPDSNSTASNAAPPSERNPAEAAPTLDLSPRRSSPRSTQESNAPAKPSFRTWSMSRRNVNGTQISRTITIVAMNDRWLVIQDDAANQVESVIPLNVGPSVASQRLEKAIGDRVDSWGVAVAGGYWQPKIAIQYTHDAEMSVQRLRKVLEGSNLPIELQPIR